MSRPLFAAALAVLVVAGLLPLAAMAVRITPADLSALLEARTLSLLGRTLMLGLSTGALALLLGGPFGFLVARTDMPGAAWLRTLGILPLLLPPLLIAMTWSVLLPDLRGAPASVAVLALSTFPIVAVFTARAFERIDGRQEEAALLSGGLADVLRMELPLVLPAALAGACLAFVFAVNDFAVPDYVSSVGPKFNVYADEIHFNWTQTQRPGKPVATALPLIALTLLALLPALAMRRKGSLASLVGDFVPPAPLRLRALRWPAFLFSALLLGLACGIPLARLIWEAGAMPQHVPELGLLGALPEGLATARGAFDRAFELARGDLRNSLLYSTAAALVCVPVGLVLGHGVERMASAGRGRLLEALALLPLAAPAILFGIGTVTLWNHDRTAAFYDGAGMVILLLIGRFLAFAVLVSSGAVGSLDVRLEESAELAGASPARRLLSVVAPSLRGSMLAVFLLVFVFSMRELDAAILVPAANRTAVFRVFNGVHFGRDSYVAALSLLLVFAIVLPGALWTLFARKRVEVLS